MSLETTDFDDLETTIITYFEEEWVSARPDVPVAWDNIEFDPSDNDDPWIRFSILDGNSVQASIGNDPFFRAIGIVEIQIFTPTGGGTLVSRELASDIGAIFRRVQIGGITFRAPSLSRVGPDGKWFQQNVSIPYYSDTTFQGD